VPTQIKLVLIAPTIGGRQELGRLAVVIGISQ